MLETSRAGWGFENEAALEGLVWKNLSRLLRLEPLKQQCRVKGEVCDLLALDSHQRLVIFRIDFLINLALKEWQARCQKK